MMKLYPNWKTQSGSGILKNRKIKFIECIEYAKIISVINAFIKKLELWVLNLINRDNKRLPTLSEKLSQNSLQPYESRYQKNLKNRFRDFNKIAVLARLVASPFMETLNSLFSNKKCIWTLSGRVLKRFNDALSAIAEHFKHRDETAPKLEIAIRLRNFSFLVDIIEKLNKLNLKLQEREKE
nr:unnamed protein product [Callosobruchus chinensis]